MPRKGVCGWFWRGREARKGRVGAFLAVSAKSGGNIKVAAPSNSTDEVPVPPRATRAVTGTTLFQGYAQKVLLRGYISNYARNRTFDGTDRQLK